MHSKKMFQKLRCHHVSSTLPPLLMHSKKNFHAVTRGPSRWIIAGGKILLLVHLMDSITGFCARRKVQGNISSLAWEKPSKEREQDLKKRENWGSCFCKKCYRFFILEFCAHQRSLIGVMREGDEGGKLLGEKLLASLPHCSAPARSECEPETLVWNY